MASFTDQVPKNIFWQRRQTLLRRLDNSVMEPDTDTDVFLSEIHQIWDELSILDETVSTERLTTIVYNSSRIAS